MGHSAKPHAPRTVTFWRQFLVVGMALAFGIPAGVSLYAFVYAKGYSYLSNDPKACINCHIMRDEYNSWAASSHHSVATCNSCHTPKTPIAKYLSKAENGFVHSLAFTTGKFVDPIQIRDSNMKVVKASCVECHTNLFQSTNVQHSKNMNCLQCHGDIGHR